MKKKKKKKGAPCLTPEMMPLLPARPAPRPAARVARHTPGRAARSPLLHTQATKEALVAELLSAAMTNDPRACHAAAAALSALAGGPGPPPPAPSTWKTLLTTSPGPSGGKIGPFQGETTQVFHASPTPTAGTYTNKLAFGGSLAVLELSGTWEAVRPDRVNVVFVDTHWSLLGGLLTGGSVFPPGKQPRGHWSLLCGDEEVRAFTTNKGSLFVLVRA